MDAMQPEAEGNEDRVPVLVKASFRDGAIEAEIAGEPGPGTFEAARDLVGVAFQVAPDVSRFESFYLRPTNGRADDQIHRNHSVQYISFPHFPWHHLREEFPEQYETYADLVPGEWAKVRIKVKGDKVRLFVNDVQQPTLIVNDPKRGGVAAGAIGCGSVRHGSPLRQSESLQQVSMSPFAEAREQKYKILFDV